MLEIVINFALISLPLSVPAIIALMTTTPNATRSSFLFFHNHASAIGFILMVQILAFILLAYGYYEYFNCEYGLLRSVKCSGQPNSIGGMLFDVFFYGTVYLVWIGIPALLVYITAEILTRVRQKRSNKNA